MQIIYVQHIHQEFVKDIQFGDKVRKFMKEGMRVNDFLSWDALIEFKAKRSSFDALDIFPEICMTQTGKYRGSCGSYSIKSSSQIDSAQTHVRIQKLQPRYNESAHREFIENYFKAPPLKSLTIIHAEIRFMWFKWR